MYGNSNGNSTHKTEIEVTFLNISLDEEADLIPGMVTGSIFH